MERMRRNRIGLLLMAVVLSRTSPAFAFVFRHSVVSISINVNININRSCHRNCNTIACKSPQALLRSAATYGRRSLCDIMGDGNGGHRTKKRPLSAASEEASEATGDNDSEPPPLYLEEGLFAVTKPLGWTSQDVVGKIRFVLEKDARERGAPDRRTKKRRPWMKVGHGGTLDPLATGVLVCGVGSGTKDLQKYLVGSKQYRAEVTLGYQTTTLDADPKGEVVEEKSFDHVVSYDEIDAMLQSKFTGTIQQVPPIFSALKRDGKKLYELGRKGQTAEEIKIEAREVVIHDLKLIRPDRSGDSDSDAASEPPRIEKFEIEVECGGGTYIRSLVRDIGIELGTVATMTALERTKQGRFLPEHCIPYQLLGDEPKEQKTQGSDEKTGTVFIDKKEDCNWTVETITEGIRVCRSNVLGSSDDDDDDDDDDETTERAPEDYTGKTIYQRTFYRLSSDSQVQLPNALMIEERLRFLPDPEDLEYMLPLGPRTLILREGTEEDDITEELFRIDLPAPTKSESNPERAHNGPGSLDSEIAMILYLASNPKWIQGDVLELSCDGTTGASGVVGLLSCVASKLTSMGPDELKAFKRERKEVEDEVLSLHSGQKRRENFSSVFPQGVHRLTLSDESPEFLHGAQEMIQRHFRSSASPPDVSIEQVEWSQQGPRRRYNREYRTVVGSDLDIPFPNAKELSKAVANMLLPSNVLAAANMKEERPGVDPTVPPTFVHLCPDYRDESRYLRQFLEKGHLMTVRTNYVRMERLQFYFQALPQGSPEIDLDLLDGLEVQQDTSRDYQSMTAIHHPDYAGDGLGEYFFPLETGAYEGGLSPL